MDLKHYIRTYAWEIGGAILLAFVLWTNLFPAGHVILGADVLQPIRMAEHYINFHYEWLGRVSLFYGIFYLLDTLGVSSTAQISWYLGIFLFGAYFSFLCFSTLIFPQVSRPTRMVIALFYATNLYTLYVFTATWGYSHYQILYVFIPALTGLYLKVLETQKNTFLFSFFLLTFLASTSFGNPAFALALGIYFFLLTIFLFLFRFIPFDRATWKSILILVLGAVLLNLYWILPLLPQLRTGIEGVYSSEFVDLVERLRKTSNSVFDTIRLLPTSEQSRYFPANFPYTSLSFLKQPLLLLAFLPFFLVLVGFVQKGEKRVKVLFGIFFSLFVVFIALVARARFPFEAMNTFLFQLPGLNTLRGWDKLATFTPFLLSVPLLAFFVLIQGKRYYRFVLASFFVLLVLLSLPFYLGGLQTKMSYILSGQKIKDFNTSKQSALVKIPDPYYEATAFFAADQDDNKISMLPYSPGSSVGRVGLPSWKVNGPHPAHGLYTKPYVELYDYYLPGWMFASDFEDAQYDPKWITELYGLIGVKYVLYQKDAKPDSLEKMEASRQYLESTGELDLIQENASFFLYRIDDQRLFPYLYTASEAPILKFTPEGFSQTVENFRGQISELNYERKNPREIVSSDTLTDGTTLFLNEKYDPLWSAKYVAFNGASTALDRDESVKYGNAWKIHDTLSEGRVVVYYEPIKLLCIGEWISGLTLLCVFFGLAKSCRKKNNS